MAPQQGANHHHHHHHHHHHRAAEMLPARNLMSGVAIAAMDDKYKENNSISISNSSSNNNNNNDQNEFPGSSLFEIEDGASASSHMSIDFEDSPDPSTKGGKDRYDDNDSKDPLMELELYRGMRTVLCVKLMLTAMLVLAAVLVTTLVYKSSQREEEASFRTQYEDFSLKVVDSFRHIMNNKVSTASIFSNMYSSRFGKRSYHGGDWPNITLPDFQDQFYYAGLLANSKSINFAPLVTNDTKAKWEAYATRHYETASSYWGNDGHLHGNRNRGQRRQLDHPLSSSRNVSQGMYRMDSEGNYHDEIDTVGPYLPLWQIAPVEGNEAGIMFNQYSDRIRREAIDEMLETRDRVLSDILCSDIDFHLRGPNEPDDPSSVLFYPVFDTFDRSTASVVGAISIVFYWSGHFVDILPSYVLGMTCVLESKMGRQYTFSIDGEDVTYIGEGDIHDRDYEDMKVEYTYEWLDLEKTHTFENTDTSSSEDQNSEHSHSPHPHENDVADHHLSSSDQYHHSAGGDPHFHGGVRRSLLAEPPHRNFSNRMAESVFTSSELDSTPNSKHGTTPYSHHETTPYSHHETTQETANFSQNTETQNSAVKIRLYPSKKLRKQYNKGKAARQAAGMGLIFFFTSAIFAIYNCLVERRQNAVMRAAIRSTKIVHSLFPAPVRDRLFRQSELHSKKFDSEPEENGTHLTRIKRFLPRHMTGFVESPTTRLKSFLVSGSVYSSQEGDSFIPTSGPIADMFTDTTIMFADIAGFTKWSSEREPYQVFELLEAVYRAFDAEAKRLGVFKVETIGDCYVAVVGLPDPREDHAVVMAKFAYRCLTKFSELTQELEVSLGPGTADLGLRIGLHSGPVTAGVLRGEKSRFQLFGDTMNTASRMESTGQKQMIQISQETADLIQGAGKSHWLVAREDLVTAKGKGNLQTYWLKTVGLKRSQSMRLSSLGSEHSDSHESSHESMDDEKRMGMLRNDRILEAQRPMRGKMMRQSSWKSISHARLPTPKETVHTPKKAKSAPSSASRQRLIKWNAAVLEGLLVKIASHRHRMRKNGRRHRRNSEASDDPVVLPLTNIETSEAVLFPSYDFKTAVSVAIDHDKSRNQHTINAQAKRELLDFVTRVALMYRDVAFHSFEHASHVTMSANKLMNRVCSRNFVDNAKSAGDTDAIFKDQSVSLFFSTFGISADPLAQFTVVFAALVHDVDHNGVPNAQLVKEHADVALRFENKSVAERNSVHIAWDLLMSPEYENLRSCIYADEDELCRFRQLLINVVMATDIADRGRMTREKDRWSKAFHDIAFWQDQWQYRKDEELTLIDVSMKATLALEQIMLASDVAHTMQHWFTFLNWNERLYIEQRSAYLTGRGLDPSVNWYENQISFFDGYIIPLAMKLKECGVFGTAGDEYLGYALKNRQEWREKGKEITETMITKHNGRLERESTLLLPTEGEKMKSELSTVAESQLETDGPSLSDSSIQFEIDEGISSPTSQNGAPPPPPPPSSSSDSETDNGNNTRYTIVVSDDEVVVGGATSNNIMSRRRSPLVLRREISA